jgi:hypothetical protein
VRQINCSPPPSPQFYVEPSFRHFRKYAGPWNFKTMMRNYFLANYFGAICINALDSSAITAEKVDYDFKDFSSQKFLAEFIIPFFFWSSQRTPTGFSEITRVLQRPSSKGRLVRFPLGRTHRFLQPQLQQHGASEFMCVYIMQMWFSRTWTDSVGEDPPVEIPRPVSSARLGTAAKNSI